jgi:lipoate-protein ligase A
VTTGLTTWLLRDDLAVARTGAQEMAEDLALLDAVRDDGRARLRIYRFHAPTLTLGRFQADDEVDTEACTRYGVEVVRRPTGGRALLHGAEVTYSVAMPKPPGADGAVDALYCAIAQSLIAGLAQLGIDAAVAAQPVAPAGAVCFTGVQGADLRVAGRKVCGSAQVQRGAFAMQHGSVLLDRLPFDEVDLLHFASDEDRDRTRAKLRASTVTLAELGVAADARAVADALIEGFGAA